MATELSRVQELIENPSESLAVELKRWIDPASREGQAKIIRTVLALRNYGGGYLVIGFDDSSKKPDFANTPQRVEELFNIDRIQGVISRFSSENFEVKVLFPRLNAQPYPVIAVPSGVRTPVASKSDLFCDNNSSKFISSGDVYVRTLNSNNTPSTSKAKWNDWPNIVEVCFDNREADIGRFMRRHFSQVNPENFKNLLVELATSFEKEVGVEELLLNILQEGKLRFDSAVEERSLRVAEHGAWEVALIILGDVPKYSADLSFLNLLESSNPQYTGWPVWLNSRRFSDPDMHPYVFNGAWESLIADLSSGWSNHLDFMRLNPTGRFYLRRALEDDILAVERAPQPLTELDFALPVRRVAETIAVGIAFAKGMACDPSGSVLSFAFRWSRLQSRKLSARSSPDRIFFSGGRAYQDEVTSFVNVPLDTPLSALAEYVKQTVQPLFAVFDGFSLGNEMIEEETIRIIERRLR